MPEASIRIATIRGDVAVSFNNLPETRFEVNVEIPANSTAEIWLPRLSSNNNVWINSISQKGIRDGNFVKIHVGSVRHSLTVEK